MKGKEINALYAVTQFLWVISLLNAKPNQPIKNECKGKEWLLFIASTEQAEKKHNKKKKIGECWEIGNEQCMKRHIFLFEKDVHRKEIAWVFLIRRTKVRKDFSVNSIHFCQRSYREESCDSLKGNS